MQWFLTVARFDFENFQWSISQSVAQLQYSYILRSVSDLKKKKKEKVFATDNAIFCVFSRANSKKKKKRIIIAPTQQLSDDIKEKGAYRANTTFSKQISNFQTAL